MNNPFKRRQVTQTQIQPYFRNGELIGVFGIDKYTGMNIAFKYVLYNDWPVYLDKYDAIFSVLSEVIVFAHGSSFDIDEVDARQTGRMCVNEFGELSSM